MSDLIGLSFSVEQITFAHFIKDADQSHLNYLGSIEYPFTYEEGTFFNDDNVVRLANSIINRFEALKIEQPEVAISVESNFAQLRRITAPKEFSGQELSEHIEWDLTHALLTPLENYVYLTTDNVHENEDNKEVLVIAIQKKVIEFFQKLASFCKFSIVNLSVNQLAVELCFQHMIGDLPSGLTTIFKICANRLETIYLHNGEYYQSLYEKLPDAAERKTSEVLIEKMNANIKHIESLFEQFGSQQIQVNSMYILGSGLTPELMEEIRKNTSIPVEEINPIQNITAGEEFAQNLAGMNDLHIYTESIGITLDT